MMNIYERVAMDEGARLDSVKQWVNDKTGINDLRDAALDDAIANGRINRGKKYADKAEKATTAAENAEAGSEDRNNHVNNAKFYINQSRTAFDSAKASRRDAILHSESGTRKMRNVGGAAGTLGGAVIGAAAGKGYSVYRRHQMKKRGATEKELAAHKKGDLRRMAAGAGIGGVVAGAGGRAIGGKAAKTVYDREFEMLNRK